MWKCVGSHKPKSTTAPLFEMDSSRVFDDSRRRENLFLSYHPTKVMARSGNICVLTAFGSQQYRGAWHGYSFICIQVFPSTLRLTSDCQTFIRFLYSVCRGAICIGDFFGCIIHIVCGQVASPDPLSSQSAQGLGMRLTHMMRLYSSMIELLPNPP